MKITLLTHGKTSSGWIRDGITEYEGRLQHYLKYEHVALPDLKGLGALPKPEQMRKEGELLLSRIKPGDLLLLLDEKGKALGSEDFSRDLQGLFNRGPRQLVFAVGGPYGFGDEVRRAAAGSFSLSKMTFTHDMVRLFFTEQLYRAMTILKGEKYHHS
jgi:23S rRNA (pseudouridine1915-N3)-methyltransferase